MAERFKDSPSNNKVILKEGGCEPLEYLQEYRKLQGQYLEVVHQEPRGKVFWLYKQLLIREGKKIKEIIKQENKSSRKARLSKEKNVQKSGEIKTGTTQELVLKSN